MYLLLVITSKKYVFVGVVFSFVWGAPVLRRSE